MVRKLVVAAVAVDLRLDERFLVEVLTLLLVLIDPQLWKHLGYLLRHQPAEDGVAGILRGGGKDAEIDLLVDVEEVGHLAGEHAPLVEAEVVDDDQEDLLATVNAWKDKLLEEVGTHRGARRTRLLLLAATQLKPVCAGWLPRGYPVEVVLLDVFGKPDIGLLLLHLQHVRHIALRATQFQFPAHQPLIDLGPVGKGTTVADLHGDLLVVLLIARLRHLGDDLLSVDVLLERQKNLTGIDGLDEVIGYFVSDGLVHDVFFFALGDHDDGNLGIFHLDLAEGIEPAQSRHVFVEDNEVEGLMSSFFKRISSIRYSCDFISFLL